MRNQRHWSLCLLLAALGFAPIQHSQANQLSDANFQEAINLWFTAESNATLLYGHIRDWNVSGVTVMTSAFKDRTNFNEDISDWDVSFSYQYVPDVFECFFLQPADWGLECFLRHQYGEHASKFNHWGLECQQCYQYARNF